MNTIVRKELADHLGSVRFLIITGLVFMISLITTFMAGQAIRDALEANVRAVLTGQLFLKLFTLNTMFFSLVHFIAFFGPFFGIILGFGTINRERSQGTLSKLLAQPIYRDEIILGKFLAGLIIIALMLTSLTLLVGALGLITVGAVPTVDEVARLSMFLVIAILYVGFWQGLSILFSIWFRSVATSALAAIASWIFMAFFVTIIAGMVGGGLRGGNTQDTNQVLKAQRVTEMVTMLSPVNLFGDAGNILLDPTKRTSQNLIAVGLMEQISLTRFKNSLPVEQSMILAAPYLLLLVAFTLAVFWVAYLSFMRQEVRSI